MSSPIAIPRSTKSSSSSSSSSSLASSPSMASSPALYVPVHKRAGSNSSPSRTSSPDTARFPSLPGAEATVPAPHPCIYTTEFLLSLRPTADESVKEKMRSACPEVVMNRRARKSLEFMEHQRAAAGKTHSHSEPPQPQALRQPAASPIVGPAPAPARVLPRRNRPAGRAPERRRQALQMSDSWRGMGVTPLQPLPVLHL